MKKSSTKTKKATTKKTTLAELIKIVRKPGPQKKAAPIRCSWPQTAEQAEKNGEGMFTTISSDELPYAKRLAYVIEAIKAICHTPPSDYETECLLRPLEAAQEWIKDGDPEGAAMLFFELGRRVERSYAGTFDTVSKKGINAKLQQRSISTKGGKATAHYSDKIITDAFMEYRKQNPKKSLWDACAFLVRNGNALDDYKTANSAYKKFSRIAKNQDWKSPQELFNFLLQ
jgi:hypothetical protein